MKIEKISTTKYIPTQNKKGWSEPMISCLLEVAIGYWI
jgi:hypothetical protein